HHKEIFGKAPTEVATDRGYYSSSNEMELTKLGVKHLSIPKPGKKSKSRQEIESTPKFKKLQKFRAGVEGRISCLKRSFGLRRSYLRGFKGTSTWCGYGIFAHNLRKAAKLLLS
ncbi:transposase, partial [Fusibacter ferrireducens]